MSDTISLPRARRGAFTRRLPAAAALAGLAALVSACSGTGEWAVTRNGDMAVASLSGAGMRLTSEAALTAEAEAAVRSATGCAVERIGPKGGASADRVAKLACGG